MNENGHSKYLEWCVCVRSADIVEKTFERQIQSDNFSVMSLFFAFAVLSKSFGEPKIKFRAKSDFHSK